MKKIVRLLAIVCVTQTFGLFADSHNSFRQTRPYYRDQSRSAAFNENQQQLNQPYDAQYSNGGIIRGAENAVVDTTKGAAHLAEDAVEAPVRVLGSIFGGR